MKNYGYDSLRVALDQMALIPLPLSGPMRDMKVELEAALALKKPELIQMLPTEFLDEMISIYRSRNPGFDHKPGTALCENGDTLISNLSDGSYASLSKELKDHVKSNKRGVK